MLADDSPIVSVVIATYNMAEYLGTAVTSALDDGLRDIEVVVVDDGSTDRTPAVLEAFTRPESETYDPRVRRIRQENAGKSAAVNRALEAVRGDYVAFLDADDALPADSLSRRYRAAVQGDGKADMVVGAFEVVDQKGEVVGRRHAPDIEDPVEASRRFYLGFTTPFHLNACLLSRELVERVGGFDPRLHRCVDGDYAIRALARSRGVVTIPRVVYRYRKYRGSISQRLLYRLATARYRSMVLWKTFSAPLALLLVPYGLAVDLGKMLYELFGNFQD